MRKNWQPRTRILKTPEVGAPTASVIDLSASYKWYHVND